MAKQTAVVEEAPTALVKIGNVEVTNAKELGKLLKSLTPGMEMTSEYYEFAEGQELRVIVTGSATFPKKNATAVEVAAGADKVFGVRMLSEEGEFIASADAVLVSTLRKYAEDADAGKGEKRAFVIRCVGWKESPKGSYRDFRIKPLN